MKKAIPFVTTLLLLAPALTPADQAQPATVSMVVTAETRNGKTAPEIHREDVMVYQGTDRLRVADWIPARGAHAAMQLFVLIDDALDTNVGLQIKDLSSFIESQPASTAVAVGYLHNGAVTTAQEFTNDHARAAKALRLPFGSPAGFGSPYLSLSDLTKHWPAGAPRREIFLVSDGIDRVYGSGPQNPYVDSAVGDLQRAGIVVYAIYAAGVGHQSHSLWSINWGQSYLSRVAEQTGGEAFFEGLRTPISFAHYLTQISERLGQQYLLSFAPKPEKGSHFVRVHLRTEIPGVELVGAEEVYVKP